MKKIAIILGMFFALSANAQQQISGPASICAGQSATLIAEVPGFNTDTLQFQWSQNGVLFGLSNDTIVVNPSVGVWNYSVVIVTNGNQFIGNIYTTLIVNPNPTATAANGGPYCVTQTIGLTATGGVNYVWTGPNGFSSNAQNPTRPAILANAGTYSVTVTNNNGCSATATTSVVVNANPIPTISVSPNDTVCLGTTVALFATGGVSYSWSVGGNGPSTTWTPTTTGNQIPSVFVTDANGCSALEFLPMVVHPNPAILAMGQQNVSCFGGSNGIASISLTPGSFPVIYQWNTGGTGSQINNLTPGTYTVTATNANQCSVTGSVTITQPTAAVTATVTTTNVSCNNGTNGMITVTATGGTAPYQYKIGNGPWVNSNIFSNLSAGIYTIMVRDANACQFTLTVSVSQPTILTADADSTRISCNGGNNGTAFVSFINGGTAPYTYVWNNGQTGSSISNLSIGSYTATITDANGCTVSAGTVVTQPAAITLSATVTPVTCNGGNNGSIDLTVTGGTLPYSYLWSNGFAGQDPQGLTVGTKTIAVTDTNGCTATGSWVVNQPTPLMPTTSSTNATCVANGSASVSASGGVAPYNYLWSNGATTSSISAAVGNYNVTVTDANGCQSIAMAIIAPATPVAVSNTIIPISCYAGNNGAIDLSVTGTSPFTYAWSNGATTQDLLGLGFGTYTVTVTAANGCTNTQSFTLVQPAFLNAQALATNASCFGGTGSAMVLATGGTGNYSFSWSPQGGTGSTASNLPAGAYTVTVTDANNCSVQASTVVTQPSQMVASIQNQTNAGCFGNNNGAITVTATGGTQPYSPLIQWSDGFVGGPVRTGLAPGNYTATITDANGCSASVTTTINGPTSPIVVQWYAVQNPCQGSNNGGITVNASGGVGPYTFTWGDGFTGSVRTGLVAGNYTVIITDATGCQVGPFGQTLTANQAITITTPSVVNYCVGSGQTVQATGSGGTQPYGYQWISPNNSLYSTAQNIEPTVGGIWKLIIVDGLGCTQQLYITINLVNCPLTSVAEQTLENQIKLYPNPISFNGTATVQLPSNIDDVTIQLIDLTGKILSQENVSGEFHQLNTFGISSGTYMVRIASHDQIVTKRLIVQ